MKLIVGLGNPGEKYERTRHNLGFWVLEKFLKDIVSVKKAVWEDNKKFKSDILETEIKGEKIILAKPKTFMNNSGLAVSLLANYYKIPSVDIWVLHDELDLPLESIKIRFGGGSAGHKGIASIMEKLGTEKFWRFRLGIGVSHSSKVNDRAAGVRKPLAKQKITHVEDFVLSPFTDHEKGKARELIKKSVKALELALEKDLKSAANRYNTK